MITEQSFYFLLQIGLSIILSIIGFLLKKAVANLSKMSSDINDIKQSVLLVATRHEELEKRVTKIELKVYN